MATAEIITIGTEILLGEIVDTNARHIARKLRDIGVDLYRKTSVGDNTRRIAPIVIFNVYSYWLTIACQLHNKM